jgi:acyl-CoA synthetase (AMP-forming)/AMP-acid ligase II
LERRRFRSGHYQRLLPLGGGRRFRAERFTPHEERDTFSPAALDLRAAMKFDPARVRAYVEAGWWRDDTLTGWLDRQADARPDHVALRGIDGDLSYGDLRDRVRRLADGLWSRGLRRGDVIAVQLPNSEAFVVTYLAIAALGGVMTTLHMGSGRAEIGSILAHSRARAAVCLSAFKDGSPAQTILELRADLPDLEDIFTVGEAVEGTSSLDGVAVSADTPPSEDRVPPVASDPFLLLYTSGTTAAPKGVPLNYHTMLGNARLGIPEHGLGPDDIVLSAAPFTHLFGLYSIHLALGAGAGIALLAVYSPDAMATAIGTLGPTALFAGPAHIAAAQASGALETCDLSSMRLTVLSGSACPPDLIRAFDLMMPVGRVVQLWGMTETQAGLYTRPGDDVDVAATSAGRPSPGTEVRIVDEDGGASATGAEGELQVRGCLLFPGYYRNDEANAEAFTADGWFRTGDLARVDEAGNVSITGRIKDVINRGGIKYNPREVEELLDRHPKIRQSAIVADPDERLGERAICFAVPTGEDPVSLEEILAYLEECGIAKVKFPEQLRLVDEMPMTPTRKVIKAALLAIDSGS